MLTEGASIATGLEAAPRVTRFPALHGWLLHGRGVASVRIRTLSVNVLLSSLYAFFVYSNVKFFLQTGSLVSAGLLVFNTIAMVCLLVRRSPSRVTGSIPNWVIACLTCFLPFLMRPVTSSPWGLVVLSSAGQLAGLAVMIVSLMVLNRSIGIVAANRGVKTWGPYAWVRHPMYAGEILFLVSFLLSNWTLLNAVVASAVIFGQLVRSLQEEALLLPDGGYMLYRTVVPYRLIPWLF